MSCITSFGSAWARRNTSLTPAIALEQTHQEVERRHLGVLALVRDLLRAGDELLRRLGVALEVNRPLFGLGHGGPNLTPLAPGARSEKSVHVSADVIIYSTDYCPYCVRAKALLTKKQVPFKEVRVDTREDLRSWLASASGQRTVPQIFINGESVGGFTELADLDRKGDLDRRLAESPVAGAPPLPA